MFQQKANPFKLIGIRRTKIARCHDTELQANLEGLGLLISTLKVSSGDSTPKRKV